MNGKWKHVWISVTGAAAAVLLVVVLIATWSYLTSSESQPGVTVGGPTLSAVPPAPPSSTDTETLAVPPLTDDSSTIEHLTPPPAAPVGCVQDGTSAADWNTQEDTEGVPLGPTDSQSKVFSVMVTPGQCYDTVVFAVSKLYSDNPDANVKFDAVYVTPPNGVMTDGKGDQVNLRGDADLRVTISAPVEYDYGQVPEFDPWTAYSPPVDGNFRTLQEVRYAGSFEGQTVFGLGVASKKPFAVEYSHGGAGETLIVLMVAHDDNGNG